jgi:hypothetical protein
MQELLTASFVALAALYLVKWAVRHYRSTQKGCEGCAVKKLYENPR